jgi:hypothetical protein
MKIVQETWGEVEDSLVRVIMEYDERDPLAMTFIFGSRGEIVPWLVDRQVIAMGCMGKMPVVEDADVVCRYFHGLKTNTGRDALFLYLSSPDGDITIKLARGDVVKFLNRTYVQVPYGAERIDTDALVEHLLRA